MLKRGFQFAPGYRLQEFLGRGQFGQVWRATAPGGAAAAVKFIDLSDGQGQKEYDAIRRVKQIRHANLMPITAIWLLDAQGRVIEEAPDEAIETIDLSVAAGPGHSAVYQPEIEPSWLVVAMLLGGKSLQHRLRECVTEGLPGIPAKELIAYMDESAKGIDFLNMPQHDLGEGPIAIQHSDIKPANIVLIGSSAVVCDFGLARILTRNQVTATSAAGTPAYMAPEAISGKPARTSDQYSLAVTYYHLRTGSLPVNDGSLWEVLDAHRQGNLKLGLVSEAEQAVLRKATDLKWEKRFDSNLDFVEALREALRVEGETRPSFLPVSSNASPVVSDGSTRQVQGDPTATYDLDSAVRSDDLSIEATAPFVQAEKSTQKEAFLNATHPGLEESSPPATPRSTSPGVADHIKRHPMAAVGIAATALALISAAVIASQGGGENGASAKGTGSTTIAPPPVTRTASDLLTEAIALVDKDGETAKSLFQQALVADPKLPLSPMELSGLHGSVMQMGVTSNGKWLVAMADGPSPSLHDLASPSAPPILLKGHETLLNSFAIDAKGNRLLTGGFDSDARVWNLGAKKIAASPLVLSGHGGAIEAVAWSPNQSLAITASGDMQLGLWEIGSPTSEMPAGTLKRERRIETAEALVSLACDPSGTWIAARTLGNNPLDPEPDVLCYRLEDLWNAEGSPAPLRMGAPTAKHIGFLTHQSEPTLVAGEVGGTVAIYSIAARNNLIDRLEPDVFSNQNHIDALQIVPTQEQDVIVAGAPMDRYFGGRWAPRANTNAAVLATMGSAASMSRPMADGSPPEPWTVRPGSGIPVPLPIRAR